jgi:signal peptidase I
MNKTVNNLITQGFKLTNRKGSELYFKNSKGSVVHIKGNNKIEGIIKSKVDSDFHLEEGKGTLSISMMVLMGVSTTYFTTDFTISDGHSMEPTFKNMEVIVNSKFDPNREVITRNCVVKFIDYSGERCLKRIVGMPGDEVEVTNSGLEINGKLIDKDTKWIQQRGVKVADDNVSAGFFTKQYTLQNNEYFVIGDNKNNSVDSRAYGPIEQSNILHVVVR